MQYKLLQEELKSTKSTSEIRQKIMESSLGQDPHCAAAITLVFEGLVCTESVPSPFSVTATPRPNQGSQDLPDFAPFYDKDPTDSFLTLAYHNISCMLPYRSLSPEVRFLKYFAVFGLKHHPVGDSSSSLLWNVYPTPTLNS